MKRADAVTLMDTFDALDRAVARVLTAQLHQMTAAAERLEETRNKMRNLVQKLAFASE
jgi:hypothetical protein